MTHLIVSADSLHLHDIARHFATANKLAFVSSADLECSDQIVLHFAEKGMYLSWLEKKRRLQLSVDFGSGKHAYRRASGAGKGQLIAKAVGLGRSKLAMRVLDATAGQGGDAFVLACLGCKVTMLERSVVAHAMLADALARARAYGREADSGLLDIIDNLDLRHTDANNFLAQEDVQFDVIYIDPMFPERKKSALVKKEMRIFHSLIGADSDADALLALARAKARYRVVVKRPKLAEPLAGQVPTYALRGKSIRYDIYVNSKISND